MNLFELVAKLSLDNVEYLKGLSNSEESAKGFGKSFKTAMKASAVAVGAVSSAVGVLLKKSVSGYAEYEQMTGGVRKLYGNMGKSLEEYAKDSGKSVKEVEGQWKKLEKAQNLVFKNANDAYKTTGLSANEYMSMATSFSASLINSLGGDTVKAAKQTDVAMRAISDNFNTFGGDIGLIQNAFQGFAKGQYAMLDNLKLGYGGTKTEMERLIEDANAWAVENDKAANLSIDSFSDVVTAIDYIQRKQNIAGTTAREAATTIEGSLMMTKAAWENLVTGFAKPDADISTLISEVITSVGIAVGNIVPAVKRSITGISEAFTEVLPKALSGIPNLINDIGVPLLKVGAQSVVMIGRGIISAIPELISTVTDLFGQMTSAATEFLPSMIQTGLTGLVQFSATLREGAGSLVDAGLTLIKSVADGIIQNIPTIIQTVPTIITNFAGIINDNVPKILATGVQIIVSLAQGVVQAIPLLVANFPKIIDAIWNVFTAVNWLALGGQLIKGIGAGIKSLGETIPSALKKLAKRALNSFKGVSWGSVGKFAVNLIVKAITGLVSLPGIALKKAASLGMKAFTGIAWGTVGRNIISGIVRGITGAASILLNKLKGLAKNALDAAKSALGIKSPSRVFRDQVGKNIALGMARGIDDGEHVVTKAMDALNGNLEAPIITPTVADVAKSPVDSYWGQVASDNLRTVGGGQQVTIYNTITVDGAENPEDFAERFVRKMKLDMRTA